MLEDDFRYRVVVNLKNGNDYTVFCDNVERIEEILSAAPDCESLEINECDGDIDWYVKTIYFEMGGNKHEYI